jgi:predicted nucleic acid-binding protein
VIVVDASLAAKWILQEEHSELAERLWLDTNAAHDRFVGPHILPIEITNIIRQKMRREGLVLESAESAFDKFLAMGVRCEPRLDNTRDRLYRRALQLTSRFDLPSAYDAHYLALAEHLGSDLWTADERLVRFLGGRLPFVRRLADYPAGRFNPAECARAGGRRTRAGRA